MESPKTDNSDEVSPKSVDAPKKSPSTLIGFLVFLALFGLTIVIALGLVTAASLGLSRIL